MILLGLRLLSGLVTFDATMGTLKLGDVTLHDCGGHRLSVSYYFLHIMGLNLLFFWMMLACKKKDIDD